MNRQATSGAESQPRSQIRRRQGKSPHRERSRPHQGVILTEMGRTEYKI